VNSQQSAFFRQACSDWDMFKFLGAQRQPACHILHYLQMATEKFAKAVSWRAAMPPLSHETFVDFLRSIANRQKIRNALDLKGKGQLRAWIESALPLARQIEALASDVAKRQGDGPNPEYPWPSHEPLTAPVDHDFALSHDLGAARGRKLIWMIDRLIASFPEWA
jgi:hypothetical protein